MICPFTFPLCLSRGGSYDIMRTPDGLEVGATDVDGRWAAIEIKMGESKVVKMRLRIS